MTAVVNGMLYLPSMESFGRRLSSSGSDRSFVAPVPPVTVIASTSSGLMSCSRRSAIVAVFAARRPHLEAVHVHHREALAEVADDRVPVGRAGAHVVLEKTVAAFDDLAR